jgi:hypothetical protein
MKKYITKTGDTCWTDCIARILEVEPEEVPKFVKLYKERYMDMTRKWLEENFKKGIVYIPARCFMETGGMRDNSSIGPMGYSIAHLRMLNIEDDHAVIAYNGGILYDNGESREDEYDIILGYYVIYDLEPKKARWVRGRSIKKQKKNKRKNIRNESRSTKI